MGGTSIAPPVALPWRFFPLFRRCASAGGASAGGVSAGGASAGGASAGGACDRAAAPTSATRKYQSAHQVEH